MDLALAWYVGLGVLLTVYAVLDGYDLGVGILHLVAQGDTERRLSLNAIGPLWDGNEVWLVTFGGALFAGFPEAYATILSALYLPFMLLLFFLIGRAVSIELRSKHPSRLWRAYWDGSFALASGLTVFTFGVFAGNLLVGIPVDASGRFTGSLADLAAPFPLLVGLLAVLGAAVHGATFLQLKLEGELAARIRRAGLWALGAFFVCVVVVTVLTLREVPRALTPLIDHPILVPVPLIGAAATALTARSLARPSATSARTGVAASSAMIVALTALFGIAMFPHLLYSTEGANIDLWQASSSQATLRTMSIIAVLGSPMIVTYTIIVHRVFAGRVKLGKFSY